MNKQEIERAIEYFYRRIKRGMIAKDTQQEIFETAISALEKQLTNGWIPVSERLPEQYKCVDEDDCYKMSENVLCSAYNEHTCEHETWIDYTIDGEWQTHEYYEGEKLAWQPLPSPYKEESK